MDSEAINAAIIAAIKDSAVPQIDKGRVVEEFGGAQGKVLIAKISKLAREAVDMPIEWGDMTLEEGVNDILQRFHERHPELSLEPLHQIGRCVGWNLH